MNRSHNGRRNSCKSHDPKVTVQLGRECPTNSYRTDPLISTLYIGTNIGHKGKKSALQDSKTTTYIDTVSIFQRKAAQQSSATLGFCMMHLSRNLSSRAKLPKARESAVKVSLKSCHSSPKATGISDITWCGCGQLNSTDNQVTSAVINTATNTKVQKSKDNEI